MKRILLTGASGFVGRGILKRLANDAAVDLLAVSRRPLSGLPERVGNALVEGLNPDTDWRKLVVGCRVVIHTAARVHVMQDRSADPLSEFRKTNVEGTLTLARQAAVQGVKRFIFVSSIKVNGEESPPGCCYSADDIPAPVDAYGISKMEAERGLRELAAVTGMEVVIIRPVLVYGHGVKANFRNLMGWLNRGIPLPLGGIDNRRSLVYLENLVDLIVTCLDHPAAANQIFLVSDGEDLSTPELLRRLASALGKPDRLWSLPVFWLRVAALLTGQAAVAQRLCGSLQVDISKTRRLLGWDPPVSLTSGLHETAQDFLSRSSSQADLE